MVKICLNGEGIEDVHLTVFDKDGTLIDLYTYWANMIGLRAEGICSFYGLDPTEHKQNLMFEMGVDVPNGRLRPEGPVGLLPRAVVQKAAEQYLEKLNLADVAEVCFQIFKEVDEISKERFNDFIKPIPGSIELLQKLKERGCKIAIATTDKTSRAEIAFNFLKINDLIDLIVGADAVEHSKPAPDMLNLINARLGIPGEQSIMVGDAETDIQIGINANYKASVAVCSGLTSKKRLSELTSYVVEDVSEMQVQ